MGQADLQNSILSQPAGITVTDNNAILVPDTVNKRIYRFTLRQKYSEEGLYTSAIINSEIENCEWYAVTLQGTINEGTEIIVETRISNKKNNINQQTWCETLHSSIHNNLDSEKKLSLLKALIFDEKYKSNKGRYLQYRIRFTGNGFITPLVKRIIFQYPKQNILLKD